MYLLGKALSEGRGGSEWIRGLLLVRMEACYLAVGHCKRKPEDSLHLNPQSFNSLIVLRILGSETWSPRTLVTTVFLYRKKLELFVLDPAGDWYYRWLLVIAGLVLYNWCLLVAR